MQKKLSPTKSSKVIGLVYDVPEKLVGASPICFPEDACAEWESEDTIEKIVETWRSLGFDVILFPLNENFFRHWSQNVFACTLIHSLVEGFGSLARESWLPSLCELSGVPFIGSSPFAHSVCMSKSLSKLVCQSLNIPTAPFYLIQSMSDFSLVEESFLRSPHFIKPNGEGSGMGVDVGHSLSSSPQETKKIVERLLTAYPDGVMLETHLAGPEYTNAAIGTPLQFLPIAQIEVDGGVYGLAYKGKDAMYEKVTFPTLSPALEQTIRDGTKKLVGHLQIYDFVRIDWKCNANGEVFFLEANTGAGLSYYYSVLPLMAAEMGLDYAALLQTLANSALSRQGKRNLWYGKTRIKPV